MFTTLVFPKKGNGIVINQDALISLLNLEAADSVSYEKNAGNNIVYAILIDGKSSFGEIEVVRRDKVGFAANINDIEIQTEIRAEF